MNPRIRNAALAEVFSTHPRGRPDADGWQPLEPSASPSRSDHPRLQVGPPCELVPPAGLPRKHEDHGEDVGTVYGSPRLCGDHPQGMQQPARPGGRR
ncbi:UNVERIFIED_CONTAM: hypothetical protein RKD43_007354 [Streptomyces graminofaciens]